MAPAVPIAASCWVVKPVVVAVSRKIVKPVTAWPLCDQETLMKPGFAVTVTSVGEAGPPPPALHPTTMSTNTVNRPPALLKPTNSLPSQALHRSNIDNSRQNKLLCPRFRYQPNETWMLRAQPPRVAGAIPLCKPEKHLRCRWK